VQAKWYADVMEDMTAAITGLEGDTIKERAILLYADDSAFGAWDPDWLQDATQNLCDLFRDCTNLKSNTKRTEVMICLLKKKKDQIINACVLTQYSLKARQKKFGNGGR